DAAGAHRRRRRRDRRDRRVRGADDLAGVPGGARRRRRGGAGKLRRGAGRPRDPGRGDAAARRLRGLPADPRGVPGPDPDADRARRHRRQDPRPRPRGRRLPHQAVRPPGTARAPACARPARGDPVGRVGRRVRERRPVDRLRGARGPPGRGHRSSDVDRVSAPRGAGPPRRLRPPTPPAAGAGVGVGVGGRPGLPEGVRAPAPPEARRRRRAAAVHRDRVGDRVPDDPPGL
ncbi:MAG: Two-component transcriptional response regulator, winged helix family, partial [uncultured Thermomicrobiales bacterium]